LGKRLADENYMHEEIKRWVDSENACSHFVQEFLSLCFILKSIKIKFIIIIIIITMAQQPYMGSGHLLPPLSEVTGDWPTGRAAVLSILM
jgi:hypothetical protein